MLHRLLPKVRRHGLRKGLRVWWHSSTRRECDRFILRLHVALEISLVVLWAALLTTWSNSLWGQGFLATTNFGWILILWLPTFYVVRTRWFQRALKRILKLAGWSLAWVFGLQLRPRPRWNVWRPYWLATLGGCVYLTVWHTPWGLFVAVFVLALAVLVYLLLHVGGTYGTGIPRGNMELVEKHHPIAFFLFGVESLPGFSKIVAFLPALWLLTCPLIVNFSKPVGEILTSWLYWAFGPFTLIYWIGWGAIKWRRYANIVTKYGDALAVSPESGLRPGVKIATIQISKIATVAGDTFLGAYRVYDPGFQFKDGEQYRVRWPNTTFVRAIDEKRGRV